MQYVVKGKYLRGAEIVFDKFNDLNQAKEFVKTKLQNDAALNVKVIYRIYDFDDVVLKEYDPSKDNLSTLQMALQDKDEQGSSGRSSSSFRPTPFNTVARPPGSPQKWLKDDEEK